MKLETKHLVPYLPYGLSLKLRNDIIELHGLLYLEDRIISYGIGEILNECEISLIKPILRPLSNLTKEIEVNGEKFVPIEILNKLQGEYPLFIEDESFFITDSCNLNMLEIHEVYVIYQKLFEWHFDIFELIEEGLAIDINTL